MPFTAQRSALCRWSTLHTHPAGSPLPRPFNSRTFRGSGAASISYSYRLNHLQHTHVSRTRRLISDVMSALALTRPPRYNNCVADLHLWPAADGVRSSIISVFFSDTVRPAASKTATMLVIPLARPSTDLDSIPASPAYSMPQNCPPYTCYSGSAFVTTPSSSRSSSR